MRKIKIVFEVLVFIFTFFVTLYFMNKTIERKTIKDSISYYSYKIDSIEKSIYKEITYDTSNYNLYKKDLLPIIFKDTLYEKDIIIKIKNINPEYDLFNLREFEKAILFNKMTYLKFMDNKKDLELKLKSL